MEGIQSGYAFATRILGAQVSSARASTYANQVNDAIDFLEKQLRSHASSRQGDAQLGGFLAEEWHAGTFNIDAVASESRSRAYAGQPDSGGSLRRGDYGSVDIQVKMGDGQTSDYSLKYNKSASSSAHDQAAPHKDGTGTKYGTQKRLFSSDQAEPGKEISSRRALDGKEEYREGYKETAELATDRVKEDGAESKPLSKEEDLQLAKEVKEGDLDLADHGIDIDNAIKAKYTLKQSTKAGLNAAMVAAAMTLAPAVLKAIGYLVKTKEIDIDALRKTGVDVLSASAKGFVHGFLACGFQLLCEQGKFGTALKGVPPTIIGVFTSLAFQAVEDSIMVALGKKTPRELGAHFVDGVAMSGGFLLGAAITTALGVTVPLLGLVLGSLIGTAFSAAYDFGKKKFLSFCVDSGFAAFGLVDQDYTLPEEALKEMGIDFAPITRVNVSTASIARANIAQTKSSAAIEAVDIRVVKRGIIGVNKIGYTL